MIQSFFDCYMWYFFILLILGNNIAGKKKIFAAEHSEVNAPLDYSRGDDYRMKIGMAILIFLPMIIIAGNRAEAGFADTFVYVDGFNELPTSVSGLTSYLGAVQREKGFVIFNFIIKILCGGNVDFWLLTIAAISGISMAYVYSKYTSDVVWCAFFYFASTDFFSWMMNGMRQFLAVAVVFACFPFLMRKNLSGKIIFIAVALIMSTFHESAILTIPLYLIALGEPFNKKTMVILGAFVLAVVFVGQFTNVMNSALENTNYGYAVNQMNADTGTSYQRVFFYSIPAVLAIIFRKKIPEDAPEIIKVSINMSLISMGFYLIAMVTSGIYIGRLPIYFSLFSYILLPWELRTFFDKNMHQTMFYGVAGLYLVFFYLQMQLWGWIK